MQSSKKKRNESGYVYIITNSAFKGYVKIGVTKNIKNRLRTYQTSSPHRNYKIEHYIHHPDCYKAEQEIHEMMNYFALNKKNEWFQIDLEIAKNRLDETLCSD
jgi:predicted GIY-YIG superfamily endonuclease|tara:strand:+ start:852 stop:1160 length:309 start_codon:yes stop_codon:yes gene_type:complete